LLTTGNKWPETYAGIKLYIVEIFTLNYAAFMLCIKSWATS